MPHPLFIASIGNPGRYLGTLHSAGHTLLDAIRPSLSSLPLSAAALYQSPSPMNASGPAVSKAYKAFLSSLPPPDRAGARLVVLHDELERPLGQVGLRSGGSVRGHNGLRSLVQSMGGPARFVRIGVGIGRPETRERGGVSEYVLRRMTAVEKDAIRASAGDVLALIEKLREDGG